MKDQSQNRNYVPFDSLSIEIESVIQTTNTQLEIWTDCLLGGSNANKAYNLSYSITFKGDFVLLAFENALASTVKRHECLRASFSFDGTYMNIYKNVKIEISHDDISQLPTNEQQKAKESIINEEVNSLFDLVKGPLFKVKLIRVASLENILIISHRLYFN